MEDQKMTVIKLLKMPGYVYQVTKGNTGSRVRVSDVDDILVQAYCKQHGKPRPTILHLMIVQATKCWVEKHEERLNEMEEMGVMRLKLAAAEHILALYAERFGPLPSLRHYKRLDKQ